MVISCMTVYVIAFSSAFLLGKSYATTTPAPLDVTPQQSDRRNTKIQFQSQVRFNNLTDVPETRLNENPKLLQSHFLPSNLKKEPNQFENGARGQRPYFALYDPTNNVTNKLETSGQNLPPEIRYEDFYSLARSKTKPEGKGFYLKDVKSGKERRVKNFIERDTLRDSEEEVRIHYNGITAKETVVKTGVDEDTGKRLGIKLRQLTDGKRFIQLIYNFENEIQDCEYIKQKPLIQSFVASFLKNVENAKEIYENEIKDKELQKELEEEEGEEEDDDYLEEDEGKIEKYSLNEDLEQYEGEDLSSEKEYRNVTFQIIRGDEALPREFAEWMNYPSLKRKCRENHKILRQIAYDKKHGDAVAKKQAEEHIERMKRSLDFPLIFPGTKWCGKSHIAEKYTALGGFSKTDKCCRAHDHCHPLISGFEEKYGFYNFRPYTINHCRCDLRRKRDLMDVLMVPGTKWCGKGRRATKYTSLGGFSRTDKCCRVHDTMCPHWIGSLEEKYGFFNWRINTIMHCRCDKRFRACLKMAKTGTANFVGKLFFNVVQTKCFVLKPQEVCTSYSWWGKCEKKEYRKKAYLRDNLSY